MEEVNLYIEPPPGVTAGLVDCKITPNHLRLGIKGNPPFLDVSGSACVAVGMHVFCGVMSCHVMSCHVM